MCVRQFHANYKRSHSRPHCYAMLAVGMETGLSLWNADPSVMQSRWPSCDPMIMDSNCALPIWHSCDLCYVLLFHPTYLNIYCVVCGYRPCTYDMKELKNISVFCQVGIIVATLRSISRSCSDHFPFFFSRRTLLGVSLPS